MSCEYTCPNCGGSGKETEIRIRGEKVEKVTVTCSRCNGKGHIRA